jgi:hypothetical protein
MNMAMAKGVMILAVGAGLLVMCALDGFDGVRGLAGAACFGVAAKGIA